VVFHVRQENTGTTVVRSWIEHNIFDAKGRITEARTPAACIGYGVTVVDGFVVDVTPSNTGTTGLVHMYDYHPDELGGGRSAERWRIGTTPAPGNLVNSQSRILHEVPFTDKYGRTEVSQHHEVAKTVDYTATGITDPSAGTPEQRLETTFSYVWFNKDDPADIALGYDAEHAPHLLKWKTATRETVSAAELGDGQPVQTIEHFAFFRIDEDQFLHWNDWTRHPDGRLTLTLMGTDPGDTTGNTYRRTWCSIDDVKTDSAGNVLDADPRLAALKAPVDPSGLQWANPNGRHLKTLTRYDGRGRVVETTRPDGSRQRSIDRIVEKTVGGRPQTVAEVDLSITVASGSEGDYFQTPTSISIRSADGRFRTDATGGPLTGMDGDVLNDFLAGFWDGSLALEQAYQGLLLSRTEHEDDDQGRPFEDRRWSDPANPAASKLVTRHTYDALGRRILTLREDGTEEKTVYDALDRAVQTWQRNSLIANSAFAQLSQTIFRAPDPLAGHPAARLPYRHGNHRLIR